MTAHHERFVLIRLRIESMDWSVTISVRNLYLGALACPLSSPVLGSLEDRIDVFPLVMEHIEVVEAGRLPFQMPFTDQGSLVTAKPAFAWRYRLPGPTRPPAYRRRCGGCNAPVIIAARLGAEIEFVQKRLLLCAAFGGQAADILVLHIVGQNTSTGALCHADEIKSSRIKRKEYSDVLPSFSPELLAELQPIKGRHVANIPAFTIRLAFLIFILLFQFFPVRGVLFRFTRVRLSPRSLRISSAIFISLAASSGY